MKEYNYGKSIMFCVFNDINGYCEDLKLEFFKKIKDNHIKMNVDYVEKNFISIEFMTYDNIMKLVFKYNDFLFNNCYQFDGIYQSENYIGTKPIITKLFSYLKKEYVIVTKKEPLLCTGCEEQIGWIFNDDGLDDNSVCACGSDILDKDMYDIHMESYRCCECGDYYCNDCGYSNDYDFGFVCNTCKEEEFENYKNCQCNGDCDECMYDWKCNYEERMLEKWATCKFNENDKRCEDCENCNCREECLSDAEDSRDGYAMFKDSIVGCGYDSMDDFWECNGI